MSGVENGEWRDIPGYEGRYKICTDGRVYSAERHQEIKPYVHHTGYLCVNLLAEDGRRRLHNIHRLLAVTFIGPAPRSTHAHHKDENKLNNSLDNIEYMPRHKHIAAHSRDRSLSGGRIPGMLLCDEVQRILDESDKCLKSKDVSLEFSSRYPGMYNEHSVYGALGDLARTGRIQKVSHGWYTGNKNKSYVVKTERKQYVPIATCVSYEDKNTIDELSQSTGKTISEITRSLIERALNSH